MQRRRSVWREGAVVLSALVFGAVLMTSCQGSSPTATTTNISPPDIQMQIVSGSGQTGTVGSTLNDPLVVRATDSRGHPESGQVVNFVVVSGGGSVFAGTGITDSKGMAQDYWTLGPTTGQQVVEARAVDPETGKRLVFATFTATAVAAAGPVLAEQSLDFSSLGDTVRLDVTTPNPTSGAMGASSGSSPTLHWASSDPSVVSVDSTGLVEARADGDALVTVTDSVGADTAKVHVQQVVASVQVAPSSTTLQAGDTVALSASTMDANGYPVHGAAVRWGSNNPSVATVGSSGTVVAVAPGQDTVVATSENVRGTATVAVTSAQSSGSASISLSSGLAFTSLKDTARLTVTATDASGNTLRPTDLTWSTRDAGVATVDASGLVESVADGRTYIVATYGTAVDSAAVSVVQQVKTVIVSPFSTSLNVGDTVALSAMAVDANQVQVQGVSFTWSNADTSVASLSPAAVVTAKAVGSDVVTATTSGVSGQAHINVTTSSSTSPQVSISPSSLSFASLQDTTRLSVTAQDGSGNTLTASQLAWMSTNTSVATVSSTGLVRSAGNGTASVIASYGGVADTTTVSVRQQVASVTVSPSPDSMTVGDTLSLKASATDANGVAIAGASFTWSSGNATVASVSSSGTVTAKAAGTTSVTALSGSVSGRAQIVVAAATSTPPQVTISPSSLSFASLLDTARLSVTAKDGSGNALTASQLTWTSTNTSVATVSSTGLVRSAGNGSARVVASYGGVADTTSVSVAQVVASVAVSPSSVSLVVGGTQALTAAAKDARGNTVSGASVTWTTNNATVATVSTAGVVTATSAGSATVTATSNGKSASASVSVTTSGGALPSKGWPDEPAGYVAFNDQPWNALASNGWGHVNLASESRIVTDSTAPFSPTNVLEEFYPKGYPANGVAPSADYLLMGGAKAMFVGMWFKASPNWQGHPTGINKIFYFFNSGAYQTANIIFVMRGPPGGPYYLQPYGQGYPDTRGFLAQNVHQVPMVPGRWYRLEFQFDVDRKIIRWWQDGVLLGSYTDYGYPPTGFRNVDITSVWGGAGTQPKQHDDYFRFDHSYVSVPGSGGTGSTGGGQAPVASVSVSPSSTGLSVGDTATLQATLKDSTGNVLTGQTVTWSSSASGIATVSGSGLVTGVTAGNATITATSGGVSGTAQVTVTTSTQTTTNPGTVTDLRVASSTDSSVTLQWTQVDDGTGNPANYALRYGSPTISWGSASGTQILVSGNGIGTTRTYMWTGLQASTTYQFQLVAYRGTPSVNAVYGQLSDTVTGQTMASAPPPSTTGQQLVSEGFESSNLANDGWFDATNVSIANVARPGSSGTHSLLWHWAQGTTAPQGSSRIDFTPSNSVYMSYWIKFSSNWIGSGLAYQPHMIQMITTADDHYIGPSLSHLTVYDEMLYLNGNLTAHPMIQDALMIDESNLNVDLTDVTEQRSIGGYNGEREFDDSLSTVGWDLYLYSAGQHTNYKMFKPRAVTISDATKTQWHHVESYWQLNSVVNGIGQQDGVLQYWVDGKLLIDRHNVYYRTGVNSTMQFRTLLLAPYMGSGSPVDQSIWIDDLTLATKKP